MNIERFLEILKEEIDISGIPIKVVPQFISKDKWSLAFDDIVKRHGRSKFGSMTVSDMFKEPSEGWFFHYSRYKNKYLEGQYSFQFVQTFGFEKNLKIKNIITDSDVSWNNGNFIVDSINKQIVIEKGWSGERLAAGHIEDMDEVKTALSIASKLHPEIIDYKFNYPRMGLKKVSDALSVSSIGEVESEIFVFWGTTEDGLKIANKSKYENITCWFDTSLAKGEIRVSQYKNPAEVGKAIVKLKFKANDKRLTKNPDGSVKVSYITKSDIVSYKASENFNINEEIMYKKYEKYSFLEESGAKIYIVSDLESFQSNYPEEYKNGKRFRKNFNKREFIYEVSNGDTGFFAAPSDVSDEQIVFSLCMIDPNLFSLRELDLVDYDNAKEMITEFILNRNLNSVIKIFFENVFQNRYERDFERKKEYIDKFIKRTKEFMDKA